MALSLVYSTSAELSEILQNKVPLVTMNDELFDLMPIDSVNASTVAWEQRGNYVGLASGRTADSGYASALREVDSRFTVQPGKYGEQIVMTEEFITDSRELGTFGNAIDLTKQQGRDQDRLLQMSIDRIRKIGWDLLCTGSYQVTGPNNVITAVGKFALTPFTVAVAWSNPATSTPLLDMRNAKLRHRGQSASFGRKAKLYLNSQDVNSLLSNTNPNDLGAKRVITVGAGAQPMTLESVNSYLLEADLPQIVEYDKFWIDTDGTVNQFIAQGYGVLVGARDMGDPVAEFLFTRNAEMVVAPQSDQRAGTGPLANLYYDFELKKKPAKGISTIGFNGAPAFYFPSAIIPFHT